jgi:hypothetical protein
MISDLDEPWVQVPASAPLLIDHANLANVHIHSSEGDVPSHCHSRGLENGSSWSFVITDNCAMLVIHDVR